MTANQAGAARPSFAALSNRPLGELGLASGRARQPFSQASSVAASNLLAKAGKALEDGDEARARAYADRAARLPFDDHEEHVPGAAEAAMVLFMLLTDALEEAAEDDVAWIEASAAAAAQADDAGRTELGATLRIIDQEYHLTPTERAAVRALADALPEGPELRDQIPEAEELGGRIMSVLRVCRAFKAALG